MTPTQETSSTSMNGQKPLKNAMDSARSNFDSARESGRSALESAKSGVSAALSDSGLSDIDLDKVSSEIRRGADYAERKAKEYTDRAIQYAKENPVPVALGAIGVGLVVAGFLARRRH